MALKFGPLALLLVGADVLASIIATCPIHVYRLLSRSKRVHAILNYAAFYREFFLPRKGKSLSYFVLIAINNMPFSRLKSNHSLLLFEATENQVLPVRAVVTGHLPKYSLKKSRKLKSQSL